MKPIGTPELGMMTINVGNPPGLASLFSPVSAYATGVVNDVTGGIGNAVGSAVTGAIAPKLDNLLLQARVDIAQRQGKSPNQVTDLELAKYFSNLPSAELTDAISLQMSLMTTSLRNAILIFGGTIAFALLLGKLSDRRRAT